MFRKNILVCNIANFESIIGEIISDEIKGVYIDVHVCGKRPRFTKMDYVSIDVLKESRPWIISMVMEQVAKEQRLDADLAEISIKVVK